MKLESLDKFEVLNSQEINVIQGGLAAESTVESKKHDSDSVGQEEVQQ